MAKFCTKCGKELVDGKCPKCKEEEVVTTSTVDVKELFMSCLNVFKKIVTKPIEAISEFVVENKFISGIIMIVATAISTGIYRISSLKNASVSSVANMSLQDFGSLLGKAMSGKGTEISYFKEFMIEFFRNLSVYAIIVLVGYLIVSKLFGGKTTLKQMVNVVGISLALVFAANLVNSILVIFDGELVSYIVSYVFTFATCMSYLLILGGVEKTSSITKEKLFITVISIVIMGSIALDLVSKIIK